MDLASMRTLVRRDLKDEDASNYRWTNDEIDRAVARAVIEFSRYCPREMKSTIATISGSDQVDISALTPRLSVDKVEFPAGSTPRAFARFDIYLNVLYLLETEGNGMNCTIYWTTVHTLGASSSTLPDQHEDLVVLGATAYAAISQSEYTTNRANYGGEDVDRDYRSWGEARLRDFIKGCRQITARLKKQRLIYDNNT
jgi:hypothetical protein